MKFEIPVTKDHYQRSKHPDGMENGVMSLALRDRFPYLESRYTYFCNIGGMVSCGPGFQSFDISCEDAERYRNLILRSEGFTYTVDITNSLVIATIRFHDRPPVWYWFSRRLFRQLFRISTRMLRWHRV